MIPAALLLGVLFTAVRSSWSWVSFGYPLTFGLVSACIGCRDFQLPPYNGFWFSLGIGLFGLLLVAREDSGCLLQPTDLRPLHLQDLPQWGNDS